MERQMAIYIFFERLYSYVVRLVFACLTSASVIELKRSSKFTSAAFAVSINSNLSHPFLAIVLVRRSSMKEVRLAFPLKELVTNGFLLAMSRLLVPTIFWMWASASLSLKSQHSMDRMWDSWHNFLSCLLLWNRFFFLRHKWVSRSLSSAVSVLPMMVAMSKSRS